MATRSRKASPAKASTPASRRKQHAGPAAPRKQPRGTAASRADKYDLYLQSVQAPDVEVKFFDRAYRSRHGRGPVTLREDFCGTAAVCYEWIKAGRDHRAVGIDLDSEPLSWGANRFGPTLSDEQSSRLQLVHGDVNHVGAKADVIAAQNFSYYCFQTRDLLRAYLRQAYRCLNKGGMIVMDVLGGSELHDSDCQEETSHGAFTYVWDHVDFDPISHHCLFAIHFRFRDGSEMRNAFQYDWRLWTLPELRELLAEAGFSSSDVYWEGTDRKTGDGNGVYRVRERGDADPAWVVYLVGWK